MEMFLGDIENSASGPFRRLLGVGGRRQFSLDGISSQDRWAISRWIAAQMIRTPSQRERIWQQGGSRPESSPYDKANQHHGYITVCVNMMATLIRDRRWGLGSSEHCLLTSDSPVQPMSLEGTDEPLSGAWWWDIYLPLDPYRFIYIPVSPESVKGVEINATGDFGCVLENDAAAVLNRLMVERANRHVFWHPDHSPWSPSPEFSEEAAMRQRLRNRPDKQILDPRHVEMNQSLHANLQRLVTDASKAGGRTQDALDAHSVPTDDSGLDTSSLDRLQDCDERGPIS